MKLYTQKKRWKWLLFSVAVVIVVLSLAYTNRIVSKIAGEEREKAQIWAKAIQRKASLVNYTDELFEKLKQQEKDRVDLWAEANQRLILANSSEEISFPLKIISSNKTIPVIVTNDNNIITNYANVVGDFKKGDVFTDTLKKAFSAYPPISINYYGNKHIFLYYNNSTLFYELQEVMNDLIKSFITEVVLNSASAPVIITDSTMANPIAFGNIDKHQMKDTSYFRTLINEMQSENMPIEITLLTYGKCYVFYKNSYLLTQLRYYPYIQFGVIGLFLLVSYFLFSTSRNSEQNKVWMGMAKETAHQLGTPLSSLMAWLDYLKSKQVDESITLEMEKDLQRLQVITDRFSKIGSEIKLEDVNVVHVLANSIDYLKVRTSKKTAYQLVVKAENDLMVPINVSLFDWVIENICKNAVDAMSGVGTITIEVSQDAKWVIIDMTDTGKGMAKKYVKTIFNPGYTTKQRGWGLGLSLSKRIIEKGHKGKLFVKKSVIGKGTTFRILLKK